MMSYVFQVSIQVYRTTKNINRISHNDVLKLNFSQGPRTKLFICKPFYAQMSFSNVTVALQ